MKQSSISTRLDKQSISKSPLPRKQDRVTSLNEDEIEELREAFNLFDTEGIGRIDPKELRSAMQSLGKSHKNYRIRRQKSYNLLYDRWIR